MWKPNIEETKQHFRDWWNREGLVVGPSAVPASDGFGHEALAVPAEPASIREAYTDGVGRAARNHYALSKRSFAADTLPISCTDIGPGSLALFLGAEPGFSPQTVWFEPCLRDCANLEDLPPFTFDESNAWWRVTEQTVKACAELAAGKYMVGCPDLVENVDILSALRDPQTLLMDMIERPEWIERKVSEINQVWFEAYQRIYDIIKLEDGSAAFGAFSLWGPGKTAKLQCDASAMFSPEMFRRFVVPALSEQCAWLDHSMYHLDGTQALCHLDALLAIDALDAIEWTPQAGIEKGGSPRWYPLYRRILDAGKSVQITDVAKEDLAPLLDAIGSKGVYAMGPSSSVAESNEMAAIADRYR